MVVSYVMSTNKKNKYCLYKVIHNGEQMLACVWHVCLYLAMLCVVTALYTIPASVCVLEMIVVRKLPKTMHVQYS